MLPGVGHWVTGIDLAWIFQPYLACAAACAVLYGLCAAPAVALAARLRLLHRCAVGAALRLCRLGRIKELTAAFLLALGIAVTAGCSPPSSRGARAMVPVGSPGRR